MSENPLLQTFATPVYQRVLPGTEAVNKGLRELILSRMPADWQPSRSVMGGWHSGLDFFNWGGQDVAQLTHWVQQGVGEMSRECLRGKLQGAEVTLFGWANVLFDGGFNKVHDHGEYTWSGVYYVDKGDAGDDPNNGILEFIDPRSGVAEAMKKVVRIQPTAGGLVIFPGWLKHYVLPYRGSDPRISVAFNVKILLKAGAAATA